MATLSARMLSASIKREHLKSRTIVPVGLILIPESDRLPEEFQQVVRGSEQYDLLRPDRVDSRFSEAFLNGVLGRMTRPVVILATSVGLIQVERLAGELSCTRTFLILLPPILRLPAARGIGR
jgi:hypothetical protein